MRKQKMIALAASAVVAGFHVNAMAASATWLQTSGGPYSWVNDANWSTTHPDGAGQIASFTGLNYSSGQTVTLDSNTITVGQLNIADSATAFYPVNISSGTTVAGTFTANTLVFDNGAANAILNNSGGTSNANDLISAPISLNSNLSIVASTGVAGTFTLGGVIADGVNGSMGINATGATTTGGNVVITGVANTYTGATTVSNGTLQVTGDISSTASGALGLATSSVVVGTATSPLSNLILQVNTTAALNGTNTISRPLDYSNFNSSSATGNSILSYVVPSANTGDTLTVSGQLNISTLHVFNPQVNHVGTELNFTGLITSPTAVPNGGPVNNITFNLGGTSGDTVSGVDIFRFSNVNNNFSSNLYMNDGALIVAGSVPGNLTQGTQTAAELAMDSPLGHAGSSATAITLNNGGGGNIIGSNALTSTRSVFIETPGTYFGRNVTIGGGTNTAGNGNYGTNSSNGNISSIDGYRFGGLNTTGQVNYRGDISIGSNGVGGFNKSNTVANNVAFIEPTGGILNFTGRFVDNGTVVSNATTGNITSTVTRVTINGFRNHPSLDKNADGVPDTGGAAGTNANDIIAPIPGGAIGAVTGGIVIFNNPAQSDVWAGTTEVMGGELVVDNVIGNATLGDTVTVDGGATIGGNGTVKAGLTGSTLNVFGSINPSDPTTTTLNATTSAPTPTRSVFTSEKPINFEPGSNLTIDLNSATLVTSGTATIAGADQLSDQFLTSGVAINISNGSLATTPLLNINLNYQPTVNTVYKVIDLAGSATFNGTFAVMVGGSPVSLVNGTSFPVTTSNGSTYMLTANYSGSTTAGNDLSLTLTGASNWLADADGDYGTASSWDAGVPTGTMFPILADTAVFGNVVTAIRNVSVNAFFSPQAIVFNATVPGSGYNLTGSGSFGIGSLTSNKGTDTIAVNISDSGIISVLNDSQLTLSGRVTGGTNVVVSNTAHLFLGNPAATADLVSGNPNNNPASLFTAGLANGYGGGTNVSGGQLTLVAPGALPNFSSLIVGAGALVNALDHGSLAKNNVFLSSLSLSGTTGAWTGKLDLANNDLDIQNGGIAKVTNQVKQGFNSGAWNGSGGIVSTNAASDSTHLTALGVIENSVDGTTTGAVLYSPSNATPNAFDNATAGAATDVLVKYTYYGDTNLDGKVDGSDYSRIDAAYLSGTATGWFNGDFNYDGVIDGSDYTLMDNAFNTQGAQIASEVATPTAQIAGAGSSAVPEPTTLGLIAMGAVGLLGRRRRHN